MERGIYLHFNTNQGGIINGMKNTKEIKTILAVLYYLNQTGNKDQMITNVLEYAFNRIFSSNANLLLFACAGYTQEQAMPAIMQILEKETQYKQFIKLKEGKS